MKKIILTCVFSLFVVFCNAFINDSILSKARLSKENKNYKQAIKEYVSYFKSVKSEKIDHKEVYMEVANCYYALDNKKMAVKVLKESISKYGATKEFLENNITLNKDLFSTAWTDISESYTVLRKQFVYSLENVDLYVEKNIVELDKH